LNCRFSILAIVPVLLIACGTPSEQPANKFSDPVILKIADLKDRRMGDSLYAFFNHANPRYRREAVEAFGSIQETNDIDKIGKLLMMDADADVRRAAAFALGQIQHPSSERLLLAAVVREKVPENTMTILEAYGKVTSQWKLEPEPFLDDTLRSAGLAWSLYRAGLRQKADSTANAVAMRLLDTTFAFSARLGAAHFFARGSANVASAENALITSATTDPSPDIRMAVVLALGKAGSDTSLHTLTGIIESEKDPWVVVNAIRALRSYPFKGSHETLIQSLGHRNKHVVIAASETIRDAVDFSYWVRVSTFIDRVSDWRAVANLYEGVLRESQHKQVAGEIRQLFEKQTDPYAKAAFVSALKHYPSDYEFVLRALREADTAIVRSAAAATLVEMNMSRHFSRSQRAAFARMYADIIRASDDPAGIGTIASALADESLGYRGVVSDISFLREARARLTLPEHVEAIQPVEAAIAYLEGKPAPKVETEFNHPIDWEFVKQIPNDLTVAIKTNRGRIVMKLFVDEAPGSVANFLKLARENYFDKKFFHRVVPNFVIQTGCNRGDGWGSEDYSIRSEFSQRRYTTGSVGMASAGKDTEGTQWFVTHSPTPHLDGRYTIFGEVLDGMKVVDFIQVGDIIEDVEIKDFGASQ
jgi:cyclophilin family peptidyl-prolyl cis-trans isomerase/HEAT repeat protein